MQLLQCIYNVPVIHQITYFGLFRKLPSTTNESYKVIVVYNMHLDESSYIVI